MDKRFLFPNFSDSDYKLTRAVSFTELSTTKKVIIEQRYMSEKSGNLVKQYSYEQIFDHNSNTSHLEVSPVLKSDHEERRDGWKSPFPSFIPLTNSDWPKQKNKSSVIKEKFSSPNQYLPVSGMDGNKSKNILAPAKLIFDDKTSKQLNVNSENDLSTYKQKSSDNSLINESILQLEKTSLSDKNTSLKKEKFVKIENATDNSILNEKDKDRQIKGSISGNKDEGDITELKKRLRSLIEEEPKKESRKYLSWPLIFVLLLPVSLAYLTFVVYDTKTFNNFCDPRFKTDEIPQELNKCIYSQETAVNILSKHFLEKDKQTGLDVIALIGGTGVGKSYTSEIIKNILKQTNNIIDVFPPLYTKEDETYSSLSVCRCNLVRLENLKTDDIPDTVNFIDNLRKKVKNYCLLILALFNTQETDINLKKTLDLNKSFSIIDKKFKEANVQATIVSFVPMTNEALTNCIKDAADYSNVKLSSDQIQYVMQDLLMADSGCKRAYAKVQVVGKTIKN